MIDPSFTVRELEMRDRELRKADAEIGKLRVAATSLLAALDDMHGRGETFTARVSIAASKMRQALAVQ